jgi:hypothetical protein
MPATTHHIHPVLHADNMATVIIWTPNMVMGSMDYQHHLLQYDVALLRPQQTSQGPTLSKFLVSQGNYSEMLNQGT